MLTYELITPDYILYLGAWAILTIIMYNYTPKPVELEKIEDEVERKKLINLYYTNYVSCIHSSSVTLICKEKPF